MAAYLLRRTIILIVSLFVAAVALFVEHGVEGTSVPQIAEAAGISLRTLWRYFPSKEDVVFTEIDDRLEEAAEKFARRAPGESPLQTIRRVVSDVIETLVAGQGEYAGLQIQLVLERPGLRAKALQRLTDTQEEIEGLLRELCPGIDEIDAVAASGIALGGMQAVVIHCRRHGYDPPSMTAALDRAMSVVEHGLGSVAGLAELSPRS